MIVIVIVVVVIGVQGIPPIEMQIESLTATFENI